MINPLRFLVPITLSCSYAFVLPVGTPANALVFDHAKLRSSDLVRWKMKSNKKEKTKSKSKYKNKSMIINNFLLPLVHSWVGNKNHIIVHHANQLPLARANHFQFWRISWMGFGHSTQQHYYKTINITFYNIKTLIFTHIKSIILPI